MTTPTDKSEVSSHKAKRDLWIDSLHPDDVRALLKDMYDQGLQSQLTNLRAQVERLHADGAVMRGALVYVGCHGHQGPGGTLLESHRTNCTFCRAVDQALSTNAGRDLLARYREAVKLLEGTKGFDMHAADWKWMNRRDTLLATVKGGVES